MPAMRAAVESVVRAEQDKILAILVCQFGDLDLAEECFQDALVTALEKWDENELPEQPVAWILKTARYSAVDKLRRQKNYREKIPIIKQLEEQALGDTKSANDELIPDERLRLLFICCHPVLSKPAQIALCLKTLCGFSINQIASAFLIKEATLSQRIVRAKKKLKVSNIRYQVPEPGFWKTRLDSVLSVIYLVFNEGYHRNGLQKGMDAALCAEAIRLGRVLVKLLPKEGEVIALLALMYFHYARFPARSDEDGMLIYLRNQDRSKWHKSYISAGDKLLRASLMKGPLGKYQIQAAISAVHDHATDFSHTDWAQIALLYQRLYVYQPNAVIELNAAVALSFASGANAGLAAIQAIQDKQSLKKYQPYYAAKADILARAGQITKAKASYKKAISMARNKSDRRYLSRQLAKLD